MVFLLGDGVGEIKAGQRVSQETPALCASPVGVHHFAQVSFLLW